MNKLFALTFTCSTAKENTSFGDGYGDHVEPSVDQNVRPCKGSQQCSGYFFTDDRPPSLSALRTYNLSALLFQDSMHIQVPENNLEVLKVSEKNFEEDFDEDFGMAHVLAKDLWARKVQNIYKKCQSKYDIKDTPLIKASRLGLANTVWGFIECANQTNTNLHTRTKWQPLDFLWLKNQQDDTALDVAIANKNVEVAKLLLSNALIDRLTLEWDSKGKSLLSLLRDPQYDEFIFGMLERKRIEVDQQQDIILYDVSSYTESETNKTRKYLEKLDHGLLGLNPNKNTILHIVTKFGDVNHVKDILEKHPSLIYSHNSEGETPGYVAAREGHADVLELMINFLKGKNNETESFVTRRKDKHNALHVAIQNHHVELVFWLIKEILQLANHTNDINESPLYHAAERSFLGILKHILSKCKEKSFDGPKGKTALHAAAVSNSAACVRHLLNEQPNLLYDKDDNGWTPLHYAVHHNNSLATKELLNVDLSIGYELMSQGNISTTAIHIAASRGHCETMEVLMNICLGCSEFIDNKERNILHVAAESKKMEVIEFIFRDESLASLINKKDNNGNTPAHILVASNFEMMERVIDSRVDLNALNNEKLTPLDMASSDVQRETLIKCIAMGTNIHDKTRSSPNIDNSDLYKKESLAKEKKSEATLIAIVDNLVIVATLIATATFAAAFTVPGGFDSNSGSKQGTPYLLKRSAFQAFVVTNALAFFFSCSVLLGHILLLIYRNRYDEAEEIKQKYIDDRIVVMYFLTGIALMAMVMAFVTGLYVVLTPSIGLAIFICIMSLVIMVCSLRA
ncbi:ankyrin repeat-containing protein [Tanacetum coccineum]